jgi:putative cofactor-binding repeat protein
METFCNSIKNHSLIRNKRVTILSTAGAEDTVIDAGGATQAVVHIAADGVQFGDHNAGFTLTNGQSYGLYSAFATDVVIAGNTARNSAFGFFLDSSGVIEARRNLATQNSAAGFILFGRTPTSYVWLHHSRSLANADGVSVSENPHRVISNSIADNAFTGLGATHGAARVTNNYITNNRDGVMVNGFDPNNLPGVGPVFSHNSIIGNRNNGLYVLGTPPGGKVVARQNNIFGNNNCGLGTFQAGVDIRNSFWGAPARPSFTEPADFICADASSTIVSVPFSATEIPVEN